MNKEKNFSIDKKEFETYEEALIWGKLFLENFNVDMILLLTIKNKKHENNF
jgi:hypothetical protein